MENNNDVFMLGGHEFHSRFILGSGKYNSHLIRALLHDVLYCRAGIRYGAAPACGKGIGIQLRMESK